MWPNGHFLLGVLLASVALVAAWIAPAAADRAEPAVETAGLAPLSAWTDLQGRWLMPAARFAKWQDMAARFAAERHRPPAVWSALIARLTRADRRTQVAAVHGAFETMAYASDVKVQRQEDHWATPYGLIEAGRGDCEDFAIAKYFALRELGFAAEDLRLLIVHDRTRRTPHAVLLVALGGDVLVLDRGRPLMHYGDDKPAAELYSLNEHSMWLHRGQPARPVPRQVAALASSR